MEMDNSSDCDREEGRVLPHTQDGRHMTGFACHCRTIVFVCAIQIQSHLVHTVHYGSTLPSSLPQSELFLKEKGIGKNEGYETTADTKPLTSV